MCFPVILFSINNIPYPKENGGNNLILRYFNRISHVRDFFITGVHKIYLNI